MNDVTQPIKKNFFWGEVQPDIIQEMDPITSIEEVEEETDNNTDLESFNPFWEEESEEENRDDELPNSNEEEQDLSLPENEEIEEEIIEEEIIEDNNLESFDPFWMEDEEQEEESEDDSLNHLEEEEEDLSLSEEDNEESEEELVEEESKENNNDTPQIEEIEKESDTSSEIFATFQKLINTTREIFTLLPEGEQFFKITGNKTENSLTEYDNYLVEDEENNIDIFIKKIDVHHEEEEEHLLQWSYNTKHKKLNIFVDEILLYECDEQQTNTQILGKLDKFIFLYETFYEELSKKYLEQQETETKRKQLNEIFRNF